MNSSINFAKPVGRAVPWLALALGVSAVAALIVLVSLLVSVQGLRAERPGLEERLAQLKSKRSEIKTVVLPGDREMVALKTRVAVMRELAGNASSLSRLLRRLETQLPEQAYLVELRYRKQPTAQIELIAEARQAEPLTRLLLSLEKDRHFGEVLLARQAQRTSNGVKWVQFDIRLKEAP